MKIVYYTDQVYKHGGIEKVIANKVNYLAKKNNYEIYIITSEQKNNAPCYKIHDNVIFYDLGINYVRNKSYFNPINLLKTPKHYYLLRKVIKKIKPDVLIVCNYSFDYYFVPFFTNNIITIKEFHSSKHFEYINRIRNKSVLKKIFYKINDLIESKYTYLALLTEDEKKYFKSRNTVVIPNSITNSPLYNASCDNKIVLSAGRIAEVKGFDKLISVWSNVVLKHPDWKLKIFGDGDTEYLEYLEKMIIDLNIQNNTFILNSINNLEKEMLNSSIYAMTSQTECFPMVLLESLSCGLPIVSFDCPNGPRHIITKNEDGIIVENQNIEAFTEAIIDLIKNEDLRKALGRKGKINSERFKSEVVMNSWEKLFVK